MSIDALGAVVGSSAFVEELRELLRSFSRNRDHLIISGESGSGKMFIASILNEMSFRNSAGNLVEITPQTHEDEVRAILFEEERRRIEGMLGRQVGSLGSQGTLVVRNVYEFSIIGQTRIARFLIHNESRAKEKKNQFRVIFLVAPEWTVKMRNRTVIDSLDQYLSTFKRIIIPPLRSRSDDIPALINLFLRSLTHKSTPPPAVDPETMKQLVGHAWHDNVRELKIVVQDGLLQSGNSIFVLPESFIDEVGLVEEILNNLLAGRRANLGAALEELEKALLRRALIRTGYDRTKSAYLLNLSDLNLRYRLRKYRLQEATAHVPEKPQDASPGN